MNEDRPDEWIAEICAHQYGVISLAQLALAGLNDWAVRERARRGRLHRVHRGVYSVAPPRLLSPAGWAMAAVLAAGDGALLSHGSAAWWWSLTQKSGRWIHLTRPGTAVRRRRGRVVHGQSALTPSDRAVHERMSVTSVARTVFDQAATASRDELSNQLDVAIERQLYHHGDMEALLERSPRARGGPILRAIFRSWQPPAFTRSGGEKVLHRLIKNSDLPRPRVNMDFHGYERDFTWPDNGLVVEYDGWDGHKTRTQQEVDRVRDATLTVVNIRVLRITGLKMHLDPGWVLETIGQALRAS